jgi:hypothetical protein
MADPVTLAIMTGVTMATTAVGGAIKGAGQLQEGDATQKMYQYKAAVAEQNARYQAVAGQEAMQNKGMEERARIGQLSLAKGAIDVTRGSAPDVVSSQRDIAVKEQGTIGAEYARRAYGEQEEGKLDIYAGDQAKKASKIAAFGSYLGAATSVSDKWLSASKSFGSGNLSSNYGVS